MARAGGGRDRTEQLPGHPSVVLAQPAALRELGETEYRRGPLEIARRVIPEQRLCPGDLRADPLPEPCALATAEPGRAGVHQPALDLAGVKHLWAVAQGHSENRAAAV